MAGLTAAALFPAFLSMTEDEREAFLKMGQATIKKKDTVKTPRKTEKERLYDAICAKMGEAFRPGNEEMLISQIMHGK